MSRYDDEAVPRWYDRFCYGWGGLCFGIWTGYLAATFFRRDAYPLEVNLVGISFLIASTLPAIGTGLFRYRHARHAAERRLRAELQTEIDLVRAPQSPNIASDTTS